jgi:hypothetical protein
MLKGQWRRKREGGEKQAEGRREGGRGESMARKRLQEEEKAEKSKRKWRSTR